MVEVKHTVPIELLGVADALAYGKGFWLTCSGCHESNEGHPTGPWSDILKAHLGGGCFECGGIGAVWDTTDYKDAEIERPRAALTRSTERLSGLVKWLDEHEDNASLLIAHLTQKQIEDARAALASPPTREEGGRDDGR